MITSKTFTIGSHEIDVDITFTMSGGYRGGYSSYGWEPDEDPCVLDVQVYVSEVRDEEGNEVELTLKELKTLGWKISEKFETEIETKCYEYASERMCD